MSWPPIFLKTTPSSNGSALSYLLNDIPVPVVLTGSMLSAEVPDSDVSENIYAAFHFALQLAMYKRRGVSVAFAGLLLHGPRVTKIDSRRKNAFVGVDYPLLGEMRDRAADAGAHRNVRDGHHRLDTSFRSSLDRKSVV